MLTVWYYLEATVSHKAGSFSSDQYQMAIPIFSVAYSYQVSYSIFSRITSYSFEVCDSLLNIGPCSQIAMGEPAFLSEEFSGSVKPDSDVELVATSGWAAYL